MLWRHLLIQSGVSNKNGIPVAIIDYRYCSVHPLYRLSNVLYCQQVVKSTLKSAGMGYKHCAETVLSLAITSLCHSFKLSGHVIQSIEATRFYNSDVLQCCISLICHELLITKRAMVKDSAWHCLGVSECHLSRRTMMWLDKIDSQHQSRLCPRGCCSS